MISPLKKSLLLLFLCLALPSCAQNDTAHFTLTGSANLEPECFSRAFPLDAGFIAARQNTQSLSLFFQSVPGKFDQADLIYFEIYQPEQVRAQLGSPTPLSAPGANDAIIGGKVGLLATCPDLLHSFYLDGEVTFTTLDQGKNAKITGSITNARIRNARTHELVAEGLSGSWDFTTRQGQPYQDFYAIP